MKHKYKSIGICILVILLSINFVLAADWYAGDLHRHTGFSTVAGYPGQGGSQCTSESEDETGYTVEQLKEHINNAGTNFWLSLTDHSYCLTSAEWNIVNSHASTYSDSSVLFLASEEVSVES